MVDQKTLVAVVELATRVDELHQQLAECRRDARVWEVEYQAKEDELNEFADTAAAEPVQSQLALEDACAQRDDDQSRLAQYEDTAADPGILTGSAGVALRSAARSVCEQIRKSVEQLSNGEDDDAMLSLSRALAHAESVVDVLNQGGELS